MDVSIVVLAWEDIDHTRECVRSLPREAEIIVVDNGSAPHIRVAIAELCGQVGAIYVQTGSNLGYARGMNAGAKLCTRSKIVLANNDVIVKPGAVQRLVEELALPAVGIAFPKVVDANDKEEVAAGRFLTLMVGIGHATGLSLLLPRLKITATPGRCDWITGPFVAMRRETFTAIGGVDESSYFYSEDLRLCWAVKQMGLGISYVADAVVGHVGDASSSRRWSPGEIALRQTREFVRAGRQLGGISGFVAASAYTFGVTLRALVGRNPLRWSLARGALQGLCAK